MVAKCGEVKIWHWAHKGTKDRFPVAWQEIVHHANDGERHIADVKTDAGWVIELQHSPIKLEERRSREAFYKKMVWVVDGFETNEGWSSIPESVGTSHTGRREFTGAESILGRVPTAAGMVRKHCASFP